MIIEARPATDNYVRVSDIKRTDTAAAVDSITSVTASIVKHTPADDDTDGDELASSSTALTLKSGESNVYHGYIADAVAIVHGVKYRLKVVTIVVIDAVTVTITEEHVFTADRGKRTPPLI